MKHVFRLIGIVVVVVVLAALVLYFLNGQGYIRGPLSDWINRMQGHIDGVVHDTQDTIQEFRGQTADPSDSIDVPTPAPELPDLATEAPVETAEPAVEPEAVPAG